MSADAGYDDFDPTIFVGLLLLCIPSLASAGVGADVGVGIGIAFGVLLASVIVFVLYKRGGGWESLGFLIALLVVLPLLGLALLYLATFAWFYF